MRSLFLRPQLILGLVAAFACQVEPSLSATLPISFEQPAYSIGNVIGQQNWTVLAPHAFTGNGVDVVSTNAINGNQSLSVPGGTPTRAAGVPVGQLSNVSWSVRVDNPGSGDFETGFANNIETGSAATPFTIVFAASGQLQYYNASNDTNTNYNGNPMWNQGTVYRVQITNIDYTNDVYDVAIIDTSMNAILVNQSLPFASPADSNPAWYVLNRGGAGAITTVDDFRTIPEPGCALLLGFGLLALLYPRFRQQRMN